MLGILGFIEDTELEFSGEYSKGIVWKLRVFAKDEYIDNFSCLRREERIGEEDK